MELADALAHDASSAEDHEPAAPRGASVYTVHWPQSPELQRLSIPEFLALVCRNALTVVPAERCVIFMFDKASNMLRAEVSSADGDDGEEEENEEELSFAPVVGVVSACFLQRRCLRMQEPYLHRAFHREHDVPTGFAMDSILVAPISLHHRTVGVIQLLNRKDPDGRGSSAAATTPSAQPPTETHDASASAATTALVSAPSPSPSPEEAEDNSEVQLRRIVAIQQRVRPGFSAKDEQRMIQLTSHVAQLLDHKLKEPLAAEVAAKLREDQARNALELLNMMNDKLEHQSTVVPDSPVARRRRPDEDEDARPPQRQISVRRRLPQPAPPDDGADMTRVMVGISRAQALFRGHHLRKLHRLAEALQQYRQLKRLTRAAVAIQRGIRRFLRRRRRKRAATTIALAFRRHRVRRRVAERSEIRKRQRRKHSTFEVRPRAGHHQLVISDVERFRMRLEGAIKIQQHIRGHQTRQQVKKVVGFTNVSKGLRNIVKLQSFLRGSLARKKVRELIKQRRERHAPTVVCMRIADTTAASSAAPRPGLYALPSSQSGAAHVVSHRAHLNKAHVDECYQHVRLQQIHAMSPTRASRQLASPFSPRVKSDRIAGLPTMVETRPLAANPLRSPRVVIERNVLPPADAQLTASELYRSFPSVVFDVARKKGRKLPPGVQFAKDWIPPSASSSPPLATIKASSNQDDDLSVYWATMVTLLFVATMWIYLTDRWMLKTVYGLVAFVVVQALQLSLAILLTSWKDMSDGLQTKLEHPWLQAFLGRAAATTRRVSG
ncbi:hypothetical protein P43SY_004100 [Pythium insidiosum]|uniref:GAF domain-containing protein n=1 Tax=Pythium insidiosum TaxID=114742 RepID=A0AAD5M2T3_PYTIN|nr:hypothetical protein P43SY_004100 [Pythium insidiosum]